MVLIWGDTEYKELWGGGYPQLSFNSRGEPQECTRQFLVDYDTQQQAVKDFLGYAEAVHNSAGNWEIARQIPHYFADYTRPSDNDYFLYADSVTAEPFGAPLTPDGEPDYTPGSTISDNETPVYNQAKLTVHYSARTFRIVEDFDVPMATSSGYHGIDESQADRYVDVMAYPSGEYLSIPKGTFKVNKPPIDVKGNATGVASDALPGAPGRIQCTHDVTVVWHQVPRRMVACAVAMIPVLGSGAQESAFEYAMGRTNASEFLGYPPDTLLCEPMEMVPWSQCDGEIVFDVTFHFKYLRTGHNYLWLPNTSRDLKCTQIGTDGVKFTPGTQSDGETVYDSYEFARLFFGYDFSAGLAP